MPERRTPAPSADASAKLRIVKVGVWGGTFYRAAEGSETPYVEAGAAVQRDAPLGRILTEADEEEGTDAMSSEVVSCFEDDDERDAAAKMQEHQLRRLVVLDRNERLVGIVSMGDLALYTTDDRLAGEVTEAVSEPSDTER